MNVGLVLATYKEELNIKELLNSIFNNLNVSKIVIVDDSPENLIQKIISNFDNIIYIHRGKKLGRGSAVITGIKEILNYGEVNIIIEIDTDLSHDPGEIPDNLKKFKEENLDLLISSRYLEGSKVLNWSFNRRLFSHLANFLTRLFLGVPVSDYTNGFRIYSRKAATHITQNCGLIGNGFMILSEILVELYYNKFKVAETKTIWRNRIRGKSTVTLKLILKSLIELFKIYKRKKMIGSKRL